MTPNGDALITAFYDRSNGNCETTGCHDITLAGVINPASGQPTVGRLGYRRVTTSSMPNLVPSAAACPAGSFPATCRPNPVQAGFLGDYMWVEVDQRRRAHMTWADTRGLNGFAEEDVYYARMTIPQFGP